MRGRRVPACVVIACMVFFSLAVGSAGAHWHAKHPRRWMIGVAMTKAYHHWNAWPACRPTVQFGALPAGEAMAADPSGCAVRVNSRYWTRRLLLWAAEPGTSGYRQVDVWGVFCIGVVEEVGTLLDRPWPIADGALLPVCGPRP